MLKDKEITTYKLCRIKNNFIYPLYVYADKPLEFNKWLTAEEGPKSDNGKVKSKLGQLAFRPGWHTSDYPVALHIGESGDSSCKPRYRAMNQVWVKCLIKANVDWQAVADKQGKSSKSKCLKQIPVNGYYKYKTNPNMCGYWYISGEIKLLHVLSDKQVKEINKGRVQDLPRRKVCMK